MRRRFSVVSTILVLGLPALAAFAEVTTQSVINPPASALFPPLPGTRPQVATPPPAPAVPVNPYVIPANPVPTAQGPVAGNVLAWDAELKEFKAKVGEKPAAEFTFNFTNVSSADVTITHVQPSCGCTTVQLPPMPWKLVPGTNGQIPVRMTLAGVPGTFFKNLTVLTDKGSKMLMIKAVIDPAPVVPMTEDERKRNQELTKADRQAVFKGDCARCHVQPVIGKIGKELYDTACGICHEAEHRATIVPNLHALPHDTNAEFWRSTIIAGRPGTLMPAFSQANGGPLSDPQISTLVDYLVATMPAKAVSTNATPVHGGN